MLKTPKESGEERKKLNEEINDLLNKHCHDCFTHCRCHWDIDWTFLTTQQMRETKKRLEEAE